VRLGRVARDALSALDQLIATGSIIETQPEFDGLFRALVEATRWRTQVAVGLTREGWDPNSSRELRGRSSSGLLVSRSRRKSPTRRQRTAIDSSSGDASGTSAHGSRVRDVGGHARNEERPGENRHPRVAMVRLIKPELDNTVTPSTSAHQARARWCSCRADVATTSAVLRRFDRRAGHPVVHERAGASANGGSR